MAKKIKLMALPLLIGAIIFATQSISSMESDDDVSKLQNSIEKVLGETSRRTADLNGTVGSVIVIGRTGSGKSSLITYLAGCDLTARKNGRGFNLETDNPLAGINICHGSNSGTTIASPIVMSNIAYWDCPGFEDTGGAANKIIHAFSLHELFSNPMPLKVLLVVPESSLQDDRSASFLETLNKMTELFQGQDQLEKLKQCLSLVITKKIVTDETIFQVILEDEIVWNKNRNLKKESIRDLLNFFADNAGTRVSCFPSPLANGEYSPIYREEILGIIQSSDYIENPAVNIFIDEEDKNLIEDLGKKLDVSLVDYMKAEGDKRIIHYCLKKIDRHQGAIGNLRQIFKDLKNNLEALKQIPLETPMIFADRLNDIIDVEDIRKTIAKINFLRTIKNDVSYHPSLWAEALSDTIKRLEMLSAAPEWQYDTASGNLYSKGILIGTSDVDGEMKRRKASSQTINKVEICSLNSLFVDADIIAPTLSISMIAPCWKIIETRTINLEGIVGVDGGNGLDGISGGTLAEHGYPGGAGGNGGHLYGKGSIFHDINLLAVCTNGGNGGNGGRGGDGANGVPGVDGDVNLLTVQQGNDFYYQTQGTLGTSGQDGGQGGQRGNGGLHGVALIEGCVWNYIAQNGASGSHDGNPGAIGIGGIHGVHSNRTLHTGLTQQEQYQEEYQQSYRARHKAAGVGYANKTAYRTATRTAYRMVPAPNQWQIDPAHQAARGSAPNGNAPVGLNNVGLQNPPAQILLNGTSLCQAYKVYYDQQAALPLVGCLIKEFPNLQ